MDDPALLSRIVDYAIAAERLGEIGTGSLIGGGLAALAGLKESFAGRLHPLEALSPSRIVTSAAWASIPCLVFGLDLAPWTQYVGAGALGYVLPQLIAGDPRGERAPVNIASYALGGIAPVAYHIAQRI